MRAGRHDRRLQFGPAVARDGVRIEDRNGHESRFSHFAVRRPSARGSRGGGQRAVAAELAAGHQAAAKREPGCWAAGRP